MSMMFEYPNFNPVALHIYGPFQIRWYGVMYVIAIFLCWLLLHYRTKQDPFWHKDKLSDLIFACVLGVILGGRLGYILFYGLANVWHEPLRIFRIWEGGMSFHGGLIGVLLAMLWFSRKYKQSYLSITDTVAPVVPIALGFGRLGNFINGELWGNITDVPWAMYFRYVDNYPRHPSQLYAIGLEGILLGLCLWFYARVPRETGKISGFFMIGYGCIRIFEEFFRVPDPQYGYLAFGWLTMGQILCLPMILVGIIVWFWHKRSLCSSI